MTAAKPKWEWGYFRAGTAITCGWFWRHWGVSYRTGVCSVYHLPSGRLVTSFVGKGIEARRLGKAFCEEIDRLVDLVALPDDPMLGLQMHQIALRLSGGRPDLRLLQGGAAGTGSAS
jgi:hypothetical protein